MGELYCCCNKAHVDCTIKCPKGRKLKPSRAYEIETWRFSNEKDQGNVAERGRIEEENQ